MQATWGLSYFRESESPQVGILFGAPRHIAGGPFLRSARLRRAESCVPAYGTQYYYGRGSGPWVFVLLGSELTSLISQLFWDQV